MQTLTEQVGRAPNVTTIFERAGLTADLAAVEELLLERAGSRSTLITVAGRHTVRAGGKRLRAALALLAARLGAVNRTTMLHAAAVAELIHTASLVHDDLVDGTARRRGQPTVHMHWDNDVALAVGVYFFALSADEMGRSGDPRIIAIYSQAVQTIVEGELNPVTLLTPFSTAQEQYLTKIGSKTAILFAAAASAGMIAGGGNEAQIAALEDYGYQLGLAFQIVDDILDYRGDEQVLGKPAGNDLRQGTITLPLIYAANENASPLWQTVIDTAAPDATLVAQVVDEVIASGGIERALDDAYRHAQRAVAALVEFPPSAARDALIALARFVVDRQL